MKSSFFRLSMLTLLLLCFYFSGAQTQFTPYDEMPGMIKSYKPQYEETFPLWGKMLYKYPVNYYEVVNAFNQSHEKENKPLVRYYKIWSREIADYVSNNGNIYVPDMNRYYKKLYNTQKHKNKSNRNNSSEWTFTGPKETFWFNYQGAEEVPEACSWQVNVYSFDVANSDHNILYSGTEKGFMNKTIDKGSSWQLIGEDYLFGGGITAVAIHPENPDIVYVAAGNQVHKTIDGGETWIPLLPPGSMFSADRLIIDKQNPETIFAATNKGVYRTTDGGNNWQQSWNVKSYDVAIKPDDENIVYAVTKQGQYFRIAISTNGGETFEYQDSFPDNILNIAGGLLAVTEANPDIVMAIFLSSNNTPYLYKYSRTFNTWTLKATGGTQAFHMDNGQGYFDLILGVSPLNENIVIVGTTTAFRSTNGGSNFSTIGGYYGPFSTHPDFQDIKMLDDGDTWVSTDGGMYLTTDNFGHTNNYYSLNNGLIGSDMWGFDQGWNEDLVVGGRYHNGNMAVAEYYGNKALRLGGAESPTGWLLKGKLRHAAFNDLGNGWILPVNPEDGPDGRFLFTKYPNMDEYGGRPGNLVFHPNYYGTIYLGEGNGFWKSEDNGETYDLLYDFGSRVRYLQISYHNPDVLYVDVVGKGLYRTSDGGYTWEQKPSLTNGSNGTYYWKGRTFFAISPNDENTIYACLQNGSWSGDIGKVFKSVDGGDTWENWTGGLSEYTKSLVVQPDINGNDIVYLFTNAKNGKTAKVFMRKNGMNNWELYDNNFPVGFYVINAKAFYRDAKLRVAGTGGVWESPMADTNFKPIVNPWIEKKDYNCMLDTLYFEDHSILKHNGASWHWEITPEPVYFESKEIRNPKVVLGNTGAYTVKLTITQNGQSYSKEIEDMVTTTTCPSIDDCSNPADVPKDIWNLLYVDSEELNFPGKAIMAFDNDFNTIWHTKWSTGSDPYPHEIRIDMGQPYLVYKFTYYTRQDGPTGRIKDYELYVTMDTLDWGEPVSTGQWTNTPAPQTVEFETGIAGQYFKLIALSEIYGNPWASAAEFTVTGCTDITGTDKCIRKINGLKAFPVPSKGIFNVTLPISSGKLEYSVYSVTGIKVLSGIINDNNVYHSFDLTNQTAGVYILYLKDKANTIYRVKLLKR